MAKKTKQPLKLSHPMDKVPRTVVDDVADALVRWFKDERGKRSNSPSQKAPRTRDEEDRLTRNEVFGLALEGEWTSEQAEAWVERQGLETFATKPDAAAYDPSKERNWTLPMALVWVASRDFDEVREVWPAWLDAHKVWGSFELGGKICWTVESQRRDENALTSRFKELSSGAVKALWRALEKGEIGATGMSKRDGARREIRALEWCDLTFGGDHPVVAFVLASVYHDKDSSSFGEAFSKVLLPTDEVVREFPQERNRERSSTCSCAFP